MWQFLLTEPIHEAGLRVLEAEGAVRLARGTDEETLIAELQDIDGAVLRARGRLTRRVLASAPRLKVVGRHGVGVDNIDLDAATALGIQVVNTPHAVTQGVVEHTVALMLDASKRISYADRRTDNTNFAILVSKSFTEPFREPIAYGKYIAQLANLLSGGVIVQRLGDLQQGRRTTEQRLSRCITRPTLASATPGDLGLVLPYRYIVNILEIFRALDKLAPGVDSRHTLLYGVEVKYYSSRLELSQSLETPIHNLFAAGDGAGVTRGLIQASASGLVVAREILARQ